MEKIDNEDNVIGISILNVSNYKKAKPISFSFQPYASVNKNDLGRRVEILDISNIISFPN